MPPFSAVSCMRVKMKMLSSVGQLTLLGLCILSQCSTVAAVSKAWREYLSRREIDNILAQLKNIDKMKEGSYKNLSYATVMDETNKLVDKRARKKRSSQRISSVKYNDKLTSVQRDAAERFFKRKPTRAEIIAINANPKSSFCVAFHYKEDFVEACPSHNEYIIDDSDLLSNDPPPPCPNPDETTNVAETLQGHECESNCSGRRSYSSGSSNGNGRSGSFGSESNGKSTTRSNRSSSRSSCRTVHRIRFDTNSVTCYDPEPDAPASQKALTKAARDERNARELAEELRRLGLS